MDDVKSLSRVVAIRNLDSKEESYTPGQDYPLVGAGEDWVEIREQEMGRRIEILQKAIDQNEAPDIVRRIDALGKFMGNWVEKITISRVCDQYGSAGSASEPYVYRPKGTGTTLYNETDNNPGTRAPSGTAIGSNQFVDYTDLDAAEAFLSNMLDENGEKIGVDWANVIVLVPNALKGAMFRALNSEYMPNVASTSINTTTLNHWGPKGIYNGVRMLSSTKLDAISTVNWFIGNFKAQFIRKWAKRMEYVTLGENTESYLKRGVAFQARIAWNMDVGATDYVFVVRNNA
jgi:hypothetical protein